MTDREALQRILEAMWSKVPFVTADFTAEVDEQVAALGGQAWVLVLSLIVTLWGGVGVVRVLQDTVNTIWGVPRYRRPHFVSKLARGVVIIALLGLGIIGTAVVAGITLAVDLPVLAALSTAVANIASRRYRLAVYRLVIGAPVRTRGAAARRHHHGRRRLPDHPRRRAVREARRGPDVRALRAVREHDRTAAYVSLIVQVFVFGTEVNVVRAQRLWPRAISPSSAPPITVPSS